MSEAGQPALLTILLLRMRIKSFQSVCWGLERTMRAAFKAPARVFPRPKIFSICGILVPPHHPKRNWMHFRCL